MAGGSTAGSLKLNKSSFTLSGVASNDTLTYTTDGGGSMSTPRVKVSVETVTLVNAAGTVLQDLPIKVADDQVSVTGSYQIPLNLAKSYPSINYANLRVIAHYKQVTQSDMGDTTTYFDYVQNLTVYFTNALYAPTCALTYEEATPGLAEKFGAFIQIYSSVKTTHQFTGKYGATLKTGTITFDGGFKNFDATTNDLVFSNIKTSGNQKLECKVTDSRGNTFTISYTLNILAYTLPQLTSVILDRCDENGEHNDHGRYALVEVAGSITPLGDKNDKSLIVNYKLPEDEAWASQDISSLFVRYVVNGKAVIGTGDFDPTLTYNFKVSLVDAFNATEVSKNITTATPLLDFHKSGTGLAIGGSATKEDTLDILLPDTRVKNINVDGDLTFSSDVPKTALTFSTDWTTSAEAYYLVKNGTLLINIISAHPTKNLTGTAYFTVMTLPEKVRKLIKSNYRFTWSSYSGGADDYSGEINPTNGDVRLQLSPQSGTIGTTHRFSMYAPIIIED